MAGIPEHAKSLSTLVDELAAEATGDFRSRLACIQNVIACRPVMYGMNLRDVDLDMDANPNAVIYNNALRSLKHS